MTTTWRAEDWNNKKAVKMVFGGGLKESDLEITPSGGKVTVLAKLGKGQRLTFLYDEG